MSWRGCDFQNWKSRVEQRLYDIEKSLTLQPDKQDKSTMRALLNGAVVDVEELRFCKDCRWCGWDEGAPFECEHPKRSAPNLIDGDLPLWSKLPDMRSLAGSCGPEAKLWEPK